MLRGEPDASELAAVTTVLLALLRQGATSPQEPDPAGHADWRVRGDAGPVPASWSASSSAPGHRGTR